MLRPRLAVWMVAGLIGVGLFAPAAGAPVSAAERKASPHAGSGAKATGGAGAKAGGSASAASQDVPPAGQNVESGSGSASGTGDSAAGAVSDGKASAGAGKASASSANSASAQTLDTRIAKLPPLTNTNIDVAQRGKDILAHLNAILRFYRAGVSSIQKVGEPSDVLYAEQSSSQATQIAQVAFQAAKNEAALLSRVPGAAGKGVTAPPPSGQGGEAQRLSATAAQAQAQLESLQAQQAALQKQMATARGAQRAALSAQLEPIEGQIELRQVTVASLGRLASFAGSQNSTGLAGDIDRLQRSAPELLSTGTKPPAPPVLESVSAVHEAGVTTQATVLFELGATLHTIDNQTRSIDALSKQATDLRTPFITALRSTIQQGQALAQQGPAPAGAAGDSQAPGETRQQYDKLTGTLQVLADATLPLSQEVVLLENARGTLTTWRAAVESEYKLVFRDLLMRVVFIGVALGIIALVSTVASRLTVKYVSDLRRRRQLLFVRRAVVGFLSGLVLLFGFVTQFSSLATFAGFISAGIAVGLQSLLLSVAAYFFIVGRYGVRVGDRITVVGVTGDVIEVGLVRFYMMELVGTGTELHSTGRVAVFANSVLFQTGTPIYKQMPGTEYAWHELTAKLNANADVPATTDTILRAVNQVYAGYSQEIQGQHQQVETWVGTALPAPTVECRLQLVDGGLQFAVLFPVRINSAAATDQAIAEELVQAMKGEGPLKTGMTELPVIKAAVKS